ncbi:ATP-dependent DNA helicase RecG [Breznakibacter xylanolyticus]|uniref:ATP-dependent DNA helicase RecG n=1 Tax=Breznakibacter xylanolyticus TaxID=990 RepID=A0A2W7PKV1_9BACT|nr:ATP-binding protein [Breznakibacter xylanolyticus]PZX09919.1 ATP-dependent DNA helicase RecG [Breznakibacter xylanolyticus]
MIIKIFDDSITFINPGNLSPSLTVADLQTDNYLAVHRNKLLAEAFYLIGEVEKHGTGFIRIRKFLLSYPKMKLLFEELNGFIRATLVTNETDGKSSGKIIQLMRENKQITIPEIAEQLSQTTRSVEKQLANLRKAGIIQRIGPAKGGYWEVTREE